MRELPAGVVVGDLGQLLDLVVALVLLGVKEVVGEQERRPGDEAGGGGAAYEREVDGRTLALMYDSVTQGTRGAGGRAG